jgi:hypothetical protein
MRTFAQFLPSATAIRACFLIALFATSLAGCGGDEGRGEAAAGDAGSATIATAVERCTDRIVSGAESANSGGGLGEDELRAYVERTYCAPFARRGWVYEDGTLSLDAYEEGYSEDCAEASAGEQPRTVPCEELESDGGLEIIDCALLRYVRRAEVQAYLEGLRQSREVECDDGTRLEDLGAP